MPGSCLDIPCNLFPSLCLPQTRMILHGCKVGCADSIITLAALVTVERLFVDPGSKTGSRFRSRSGAVAGGPGRPGAGAGAGAGPGAGASDAPKPRGASRFAVFEGDHLTALSAYRSYKKYASHLREEARGAKGKGSRRRRRDESRSGSESVSGSGSDEGGDSSGFDVNAALAAIHADNERAIQAFHKRGRGERGSNGGGGKGKRIEDRLSDWCERQGLVQAAFVRVDGMRAQLRSLLNRIQRAVGGLGEEGGDGQGASADVETASDAADAALGSGSAVPALPQRRRIPIELSADSCPQRMLASRVLESVAVGYSSQLAVCIGYVTVAPSDDGVSSRGSAAGEGDERGGRLYTRGGDEDEMDADDEAWASYRRPPTAGSSARESTTLALTAPNGPATGVGYVSLAGWRAYSRRRAAMTAAASTSDPDVLMIGPMSVLSELRPKVVVYGGVTRTSMAHLRWVSSLTGSILDRVAQAVEAIDASAPSDSRAGSGEGDQGAHAEDAAGEGARPGISGMAMGTKPEPRKKIDRVIF